MKGELTSKVMFVVAIPFVLIVTFLWCMCNLHKRGVKS